MCLLTVLQLGYSLFNADLWPNKILSVYDPLKHILINLTESFCGLYGFICTVWF